MVTHGEGRKDAPNVSAEDGTENTACCLELQREECWKKEENHREGHRGSVWQSQVEMGKPYDLEVASAVRRTQRQCWT